MKSALIWPCLDYSSPGGGRSLCTVCTEDALDSGFEIAVLGEAQVTISELISALRAGDPYSVRTDYLLK